MQWYMMVLPLQNNFYDSTSKSILMTELTKFCHLLLAVLIRMLIDGWFIAVISHYTVLRNSPVSRREICGGGAGIRTIIP